MQEANRLSDFHSVASCLKPGAGLQAELRSGWDRGTALSAWGLRPVKFKLPMGSQGGNSQQHATSETPGQLV